MSVTMPKDASRAEIDGFNPPTRFCLNDYWHGKPPTEAGRAIGEYHWKHVEATPHELMQLIAQGRAFTALLGNATHTSESGKSTGIHRHTDNFARLDYVGVDFDAGTSIEDILDDPLARDCGSFVYATASHTLQAPRSRLVLCLEQPIDDVDLAAAVVHAVVWHFRAERPDDGAKGAVRIWYGTKPGNPTQWIGGMLWHEDVERLLEEFRASPEYRAPKATATGFLADLIPSGEAPDLSIYGLKAATLDWIHNPPTQKGGRSEADADGVRDLVVCKASDQSIFDLYEHTPCGQAAGTKYQERGRDYLEQHIAGARAWCGISDEDAHAWEATKYAATGRAAEGGSAAGKEPPTPTGQAATSPQGAAQGGKDLRRFPTHDSGNADAFRELFPDAFAHNKEFGWLWWNKSHWVNGGEGEARVRRAMEVLLLRRTSDFAGTKSVMDVIPSAKIIASALALLQPNVYKGAEKFLEADNLHLLNTASGVVDLRNGAMRPGKPEDYFLWRVATPYDPTPTDADDKWGDLVLDWVRGDKEMARYLQLSMGYSITGESSEKCLFFLLGERGNNGKTTFTRAVSDTLACSIVRGISLDVFTVKSRLADTQGFGLAPLVHARYVPASEGDMDGALKGNIIKALTSHGDPIQVAEKGKQPVEWQPRIKIWAMSNHPPKLADDDAVGWRRFRIIKFDRVYADDEINPRLSEELRAPEMRAAILRWLVAGAREWYEKRLPMPQTIINANKAAALANNSAARFIEECIEADADADGKMSAADLRIQYIAWCIGNDVDESERKNDVHLGRAMGKGFTKNKTTRMWQVKIKSPQV